MKLQTLLFALIAPMAFGQLKPTYSDAEAGSHVGETATVTGKVFSVFTSSKGTTFLNFGDRFPKHVFGGIIFTSNQAAVGDVKQYEGKEVALTGQIETGPDKKPQIVINRADQIRLAGAPSTPNTPTPTATTPTPAPAPSAPAAAPAAPTPPMEKRVVEESPGKRAGKIELPPGWNSTRRGGEGIRKDLARLFGGAGRASEETSVDASMEVYPGIRFLTPLAAAKKLLNLDGVQSTRSKVATPGFPVDSFSANAFNGVFAGGFNKLVLITDTEDQIVSVLLVDSSSRTRVPNETDTAGYHTYNFITGGAKATGNLVIKHEIAPSRSFANVFVVDTLLVDPTDPDPQVPSRSSKGLTRTAGSTKPRTGKVLERTKWFVPAPIVNLILHCVGR